jgi:proteic killer suppression protein
MIQSFIHKGLQELFTEGKSIKINRVLVNRTLMRLDAIDSAMSLSDLNIPGFNFHGLEGKPKRFSIHINGPWCLTFEWLEENAYRINLENYH